MLTLLEVKNFLSLRDLRIPLRPLTVLVGPNRGGKSNILEVFRFLFDVFFPQPGTEGPSNAVTKRGGFSEVAWKGSKSSNQISIAFEGPTESSAAKASFRYEVGIAVGPGGFVAIEREHLTLREGGREFQLITEEGGYRWLTNKDGSKLVSVLSSRSAFNQAAPNWDGYPIYLGVVTWRWFQFLPPVMKRENQLGAANSLDSYGNNLSVWLMTIQTRYPEEFRKIEEVVRDTFPGIEKLLTVPTQVSVHLASEERGLVRPINVWQMSSGEIAFVALASLIYAPDDFGSSLVTIEEPENYLHPRLLSNLVSLTKQFRTGRQMQDKSLSQLMVTTHSPLLLDMMDIEDVVWVGRHDGETEARRPADKHELRELVADKELGLSDVVFSGSLDQTK